MNITPKIFRATADFTVGTESYATGDVVPADSRHIERLIAYGFVKADKKADGGIVDDAALTLIGNGDPESFTPSAGETVVPTKTTKTTKTPTTNEPKKEGSDDAAG